MAGKQDKLRFQRDLLIACLLFATGVVISGLALAQIRAESRIHTAQATPPLQGTPAQNDQSKVPAESKPGGERPTTPAPEPARPGPQTQGAAGAKPALPPAPAEKIAPPIKERQ
jgi:hypothetical protein